MLIKMISDNHSVTVTCVNPATQRKPRARITPPHPWWREVIMMTIRVIMDMDDDDESSQSSRW